MRSWRAVGNSELDDVPGRGRRLRLVERYRPQMDSLVAAEEEGRRRIAAQREERAARLAPLSHPLQDYAGVYESPILGRIEWREIANGLEMRIGVLRSRAEVFDAFEDQLRVELAGGGEVATFSFPSDGGPARSVGGYSVTPRSQNPGSHRVTTVSARKPCRIVVPTCTMVDWEGLAACQHPPQEKRQRVLRWR